MKEQRKAMESEGNFYKTKQVLETRYLPHLISFLYKGRVGDYKTQHNYQKHTTLQKHKYQNFSQKDIKQIPSKAFLYIYAQ